MQQTIIQTVSVTGHSWETERINRKHEGAQSSEWWWARLQNAITRTQRRGRPPKVCNQTQAFIVKNQNSRGHKGKESRENEADGQKETWDDNLTPTGVLVSTAGGAQRPPEGQDAFYTCYRSRSCTKEPEVTKYRSHFHRVMWPHRMQTLTQTVHPVCQCVYSRTSGRSRPRSDRDSRDG